MCSVNYKIIHKCQMLGKSAVWEEKCEFASQVGVGLNAASST